MYIIARDVMDDQDSESEFEMSLEISHSEPQSEEADSSPSPAHSNPKYIVFESCLLPLFRRFTQCGLPNTIKSYTVGTSYISQLPAQMITPRNGHHNPFRLEIFYWLQLSCTLVQPSSLTLNCRQPSNPDP
jgi:hypothetical protein